MGLQMADGKWQMANVECLGDLPAGQAGWLIG
jgi:hypothetical protein